MKLYTFPLSPNCLRVVAAANQAGLALEQVNVDLPKGEHMKPEFIRLNPNHKVPTLVDGDFVVWESTAILLHIANARPASGLLPSDPRSQVQVHQWMAWNTSNLGPACGIFVFENLVKGILGMGAADAAAVARATEDFKRFAAVLDGHLKGRKYLVGDAPTIADHHVVSALVHAQAAKIPVDEWKEISRWSRELFGSDAWSKALAALKH